MRSTPSLLSIAAVTAMAVFDAGTTHTTVCAWTPSGPQHRVAMRPTNHHYHSSKNRNVVSYSYDTSLDSSTSFGTMVLPPSMPLSEGVHVLPLLHNIKEQVLRQMATHKTSLTTFMTTVLATSLTYVLNNFAGMGPVNASIVITMLATILLPSEKLALSAVLGTYAGMANIAVIPNVGASLALGGAGAAMMELFDRKKWFVGVGGRLSFIAQCACTLHFLLSAIFAAPSAASSPASLFGPFPSMGKLIQEFPHVAVYTAIGAFFMSLWNEIFPPPNDSVLEESNWFQRMFHSVVAVAPTGLLAALPAAAVSPAFCGSFIAMSTPCQLANNYKALLGASLMGGICQQSMSGFLVGGWAGRLGTASVLAVLGCNALAKFMGLPTKATGAGANKNNSYYQQPQRYVRPIQVVVSPQPAYVLVTKKALWSGQSRPMRREYAFQYQAY